MPYRRLPNTDKARMRAMQTALEQQIETVELIIPYAFRIELQEISKIFEERLNIKNEMQTKGIAQNKKHAKLVSKAKMYLSHFLQIVNMSIQRGELSKDVRTFYGIAKEEQRLPDLSSDELIMEWGKKVINGENERILKGGNRIYHPSLAMVSINYEKFVESYEKIKVHQEIREKTSNELAEYRATADAYILKLWNILEAHFESDDEIAAREICAKWGISYVYRKAELKKIRDRKYAASISPSFDFQ